MSPAAARGAPRRRGAPPAPTRAPPLAPRLLLLLALAALLPPRALAQPYNCSAMGCPFECDAPGGCYDACARKGWSLAAQLAADAYDEPCTRRDVRAACVCSRSVHACGRLTLQRGAGEAARGGADAGRRCCVARAAACSCRSGRQRVGALPRRPGAHGARRHGGARAGLAAARCLAGALLRQRNAPCARAVLPHARRGRLHLLRQPGRAPVRVVQRRCALLRVLRACACEATVAQCQRCAQAPSSGAMTRARPWRPRRVWATRSVRALRCSVLACACVSGCVACRVPRLLTHSALGAGSDTTVYVTAYDGRIHAVSALNSCLLPACRPKLAP
jgi:hypothetical protein